MQQYLLINWSVEGTGEVDLLMDCSVNQILAGASRRWPEFKSPMAVVAEVNDEAAKLSFYKIERQTFDMELSVKRREE